MTIVIAPAAEPLGIEHELQSEQTKRQGHRWETVPGGGSQAMGKV